MFLLRYIGIFPGSICRFALAHPFCSAFFTKNAPEGNPSGASVFCLQLISQSCLKSIKLMAKLTRQLVAELLVVLLDLGALLLPCILINGKDILEGVEREVKVGKIDIFRLRM